MNNNLKPIETLRPFTRFLCTIGELPTSYLISMTYEEQLVWFCNYLEKTVIPTINNNAEAVIELQNLYTQLKSYVDNYFDNLDVQDEIDNKLDEMAEDGSLENIVKDYLNTKCEFIFPGRWGYHTSGNSNIVRYKGKVILFDTHNTWAYSYLKLMMLDYNITHIDYMIISHFDDDHRLNLEDLITDGFIDENTIYYHPACPSQIYSQTIIDWYNNIESICSARNITSIIPTEGQVVNIFDDFSLKFGNCDTDYTIANYTNANSASMIVEINHNGFKSLMMADAQGNSMERLINTNFITSEIGLYTIPHHAINTSTYTPFYDIVRPQIAVAQVQMEDLNLNKLSQNQDSALLNETGCINYYGCMNDDNLYFVEQMGTLICLNGLPHPTVGKYANPTNIYVDSSVLDNATQDGTEAHPYRDLPEALGCIADYPNKHINIILAPGHYGNGNPGGSEALKNRCNIFNWKNILTITTSGDNTDTFIDDGISVSNCFKVKISNITLLTTSTRDYAAYINNSNVYFHNCVIKSDTTTKRTYGIEINEWSNVDIRGCTFSYLTSAIYSRNNSSVSVLAINADNVTNLYSLDSTSNLLIHSHGTIASSVTNINNYNSGMFPTVNFGEIKNVNVNKIDGSFNLPFKINNLYKYMDIYYEMMWNSSQVGKGRRIVRLADLTAYGLSDFNLQSTGALKIFSCFLNIDYTNGTITISRNTAGNLEGGTMTTHTPTGGTTYDYGIKIVNIKFY